MNISHLISKMISKAVTGLIVLTVALLTTGCLNSTPKQSGVFMTRDSGTSWTSTPDLTVKGTAAPRVFPPLSVSAVGVDPRHSNNVVAGTGDDLYGSADGGKHWELLTKKLPTARKAVSVQHIEWHPIQDGTYFVTGVSAGYGKVFKTTDLGANFKDVFTVSKPGQSVTALAIDSTNGTVFAGDQLGSVFRSQDGGNSWQRVFTSTSAISALQLTGGALYAGTSGQGIWKSTNGGVSFARVGNGLESTRQTVWGLASGSGNLYAATEQGLSISRDNGANWHDIGNPLVPVGQRVQAVAVSGPNVYFATNAVVYKMTPSGDNFVPVQLKLAQNVFALAASQSETGTLFAGATSANVNFSDRYRSGLPHINVLPPGAQSH